MVYNEKIDYKALKYLYKPKGINKTQSIYDITGDIYVLYRRFLFSQININDLNNLAIKIGLSKIKPTIYQDIESNIKRLNDVELKDLLDFFIYFNKEKIIQDETYPVSVLLLNHLLVHNGYLPIIMYPNIGKHLIESADNNQAELILLLENLINHSRKLNTKQKKLTIKEITSKILENKDELEDLFGIKSLGIYGSYATGKVSEYSDIDFWVMTDKKIEISDVREIKFILNTITDHRLDVRVLNSGDLDDKDPHFVSIKIY